MKKILLIFITVTTCLLTSCTTYQTVMSEPTHNPINQKLPKMEIQYYSGGDILIADQRANVEFVKNIINSEINQNIITPTGQKQGSIEVKFDRVHLKQNLIFPFLSGFTLFSANLLGMPYTINTVDMTIYFNLLNTNGEIIDTYRYSTHKKAPLAFYYGQDAQVCMVEATKNIMKQFRDDMNSNSANIIAKLESQKLAKNEPQKQVEGLGNTALEQMIIRWDIQSRPQGADIFWRVVSKTPEVKSTNNKYLMTTPYEATKAIDIKGLTYQTSSNVRIILRCEKDGYMSQEKEFDVRMILDQEEISAFFRLVKEE